MLRDGSLEVQDSNSKKPELANGADILIELASKFQLASSFSKPDYFVPIPLVEGMASAESLTR